MSCRGRFIVIEGLEGAGKSTAISFIQHFLEQQSSVKQVMTVREPGGTEFAEKLRTLLKEKSNSEPILPMTELLLMFAARVQLIENKVKPALEQGIWVIGDRHVLSSIAYQGAGRRLGVDKVTQLIELTMGAFKPDLTIYLDIEPKLGFERIAVRGEKDRIEEEALSFFERVRAGYLEKIRQLSHVISIDASKSFEQVTEALEDELRQFIIQ